MTNNKQPQAASRYHEIEVETFEWFAGQRENYPTRHVFPTYGHLDVFLGKRAAQDTFPGILAEPDKPTNAETL